MLANLFLRALLGDPCLVTSRGNLWEPFLGTWLGNLAWEPLGTSSWEPLGTLLGNLLLGTWLGNLSELLGNLAWESCLGTFGLPGNLWEPSVGTLLGNLAWEPCLGTRSWEPGNFGKTDFGCSDLLRDLYYG